MPASQSYGLQVARLAGIPEPIIQQAKAKLQQLENQSIPEQAQFDLFTAPPDPAPQTEPHPVVETLQAQNLDDLSPRQALELLYSLKEKL